jgi:hypothetical protein
MILGAFCQAGKDLCLWKARLMGVESFSFSSLPRPIRKRFGGTLLEPGSESWISILKYGLKQWG